MSLSSSDLPAAGAAAPPAAALAPANNVGYDLEADGPTRHGPRKRRKITRSKMGCLTCRKRKKLCDEAHPTCSACARLGRVCEWPTGEESSGQLTPTTGTPNRASTSTIAHLDGISSAVDDYTGIFGSDSLQMNHTSFLPMFNSGPASMGEGSSNMRHDSSTSMIVQNVGHNTAGHNDLFAGRMLMGANAETLQQGNTEISSMLDDLFNPSIEEATMQLWSSCLNNNNIGSVLNLSQPLPSSGFTPQPHFDPPHDNAPALPSSDVSHETILRYFHSTLGPLLTCTEYNGTSGLDCFTSLFENNMNQSAQALRLCVLAWAARHMTTKGQIQYEVLSEKLEEQGRDQITSRIREWERRGSEEWSEVERLTMLAAVLALVQVKVCRGDLWGYQPFYRQLTFLSASLYPLGVTTLPLNSISFKLFEFLTIHDVLTSFSSRDDSLISSETIRDVGKPTKESIQPLTGLSFPLFYLMHRASGLIRKRRAIGDLTWNDDQHMDVVNAVEDLQDELRDEKKRMDALAKERPHLGTHRFLHEAFRTSCLLLLRSYALSHPPAAIDVGLLVRQALSLLETMYEQKLPGYTSTHSVLFISALNCVPSKTGLDERVRAMKLYKQASEIMGYVNISRSQRLVQEVWNHNHEGNLWVDWMQILEEWGWELFWT